MMKLLNILKKDRKKIHENETPGKIVNIVEKILNFTNQQKGKGYQ